MSKLGIVCRVVVGNMALIGRKLLGVRVSYSIKNLVSSLTCLRTFSTGKIYLGDKVHIRPYTEISVRGGIFSIGNNCFINRNCVISVHERIEIGNNVTIGPGTYIYDHDHDGKGGYVTAPVVIQDGVWIGANCVILKGVTIGRGSMISAGCIITKDVPENVTVIQKRKTEIVVRSEENN